MDKKIIENNWFSFCIDWIIIVQYDIRVYNDLKVRILSILFIIKSNIHMFGSSRKKNQVCMDVNK